MTDKSDTRGLVERVKQQVDDFLDEAIGPLVQDVRREAAGKPNDAQGRTDPVTDKSDTRGLHRKVKRIIDRRSHPYCSCGVPWPCDASAPDLGAALSCVRRLLDGWVIAERPSGNAWHNCGLPDDEGNCGDEPMSPSEVHIIEMVRGEG